MLGNNPQTQRSGTNKDTAAPFPYLRISSILVSRPPKHEATGSTKAHNAASRLFGDFRLLSCVHTPPTFGALELSETLKTQCSAPFNFMRRGLNRNATGHAYVTMMLRDVTATYLSVPCDFMQSCNCPECTPATPSIPSSLDQGLASAGRQR